MRISGIAFLIASATLSSQTPAVRWVNLPVTAEGPSAFSREPQIAVVDGGNVIDLGGVDGDQPVTGQIVVANSGATPVAFALPVGLSASPIRVQFPASAVVLAGEKMVIPFEYDARMDQGVGTFEIILETNDPEAKPLRQAFTLNATHLIQVGPYRDLLATASASVRFFFLPSDGSKIVAVTVEDATAPIALTRVNDPSENPFIGTAALDLTKAAQNQVKSGNVRVIGTNDAGKASYFWLQWMVPTSGH